MSRVRGLELLFNLEKSRIQSKNDCVIAVLHCLLINENLQCVGTGDEWSETNYVATEMLPENWNNNQTIYALRYSSKDKQSRLLLKATQMEHMLMVDVAMNDDAVATLPIQVDNYISDDFKNDYSSAYKDFESLVESFRKEIIENLKKPKDKNKPSSSSKPHVSAPNPRSDDRAFDPLMERDPNFDPFSPCRPPNPRSDDRGFDPLMERPRYPRVGGSDLDPFGRFGGGGMFVDPSDFGIPSRPSLPQFGVGGPGGLPRGAVPPGARFDPFMPPIRPDRRRDPSRDPDHPDFYGDFI